MPVILYTSKNTASRLIAQMLDALGPHIKLIDTTAPSVLEVPTDFDTDCIIVLSTHKSKSGTPMLTAHFPGNWGKAQMGGVDRMLNVAHGELLKQIIIEMENARIRHGLDWPLFIEADHHGPLAKVPMIFVEIGSTEKEWNNEAAAQVVAEAVNNAVISKTQDTKPATGNKTQNPKPETVFCVGGGHYAREFTKLALTQDDIAIGHICPKYAIDSLDEDTFRQAIEKNVDKVTRVLVLKDGTNAKQKEKVKILCGKFGVGYSEQ